MPRKIDAWQSEDGTIHDAECDAAHRDLELLVQASPLAENAPYARRLLEWLTSEPTAIRSKLEAFEAACPKGVAEGTRSGSSEGTR
jgi:hypothetical protein